MKTLQANELTLASLGEKFGIGETLEPYAFDEWQGNLPELDSIHARQLDRLKERYRYLKKYGLAEEEVKLTMLSPLLDLTGFFDPPFRLKTEVQVEVTTEDDGVPVKGRIDVLILYERFWVLVIEAKNNALNVTEALPQALFSMASAPVSTRPVFGLMTNGQEFLFAKLVSDSPSYALSRLFSLVNPGNDLYDVVRTLKRLAQIFVSQ